ncbi:MAG: ABC transporter permease [Candidatus Odinarchaeota archaeon]
MNQSVTFKNVYNEIGNLIFQLKTWKAIYCTLFLALKGVILGLVFTSVFGLYLGLFPAHNNSFINFINGLRAIPLTLLIPFIGAIPFLAFALYPPDVKEDSLSKEPAYLIAIGCFLYFIIGISDGIENRKKLRQLYFTKTLNFSRFKYFKSVIFYEVLPYFLTSLRLGFIFSLVLAIVLEQLIPYEGIGRLIVNTFSERNIGTMHAAQTVALLFIVAVIGVLFDIIYRFIRIKIVSWEI